MQHHDVQSIAIARPAPDVFAFVADPANLPKWTKAFRKADSEKAELATPNGAVPIGLETARNDTAGTVDWKMIFPDGAVGMAFSRITPHGPDKSVYSFVLMAPPAPLERLEGALAEQKALLAEELIALKAALEA